MNLSIKWKLSLSFVLLSLALIGSYVFIASKTFENDKISYIFDSEQTQLENLSQQIEQKFDMILFSSQSLLAGYNKRENNLNETAQSLFLQNKNISLLKITNTKSNEIILNISKNLPQKIETEVFELHKKNNSNTFSVNSIEDDYYYITNLQESNNAPIKFEIIAYIPNLIPKISNTLIIFSQGSNLLNGGELKDPNQKLFIQTVIDDTNRDRAEKTMLKQINSTRYLISSIPLNKGNLRLSSIINENEALGALKVLFNKSIIFILFSIFAVIIISLLVSSELTKSLLKLTNAALKIGKGNFSEKVDIKSKDEVGILTNSFNQMTTEIQRLLNETKDKARMEAELQTAKLVQESLFPKNSFVDYQNFNISGLCVTSSECGGDWWYYFEKNNNIYLAVADATGHGTPAALITSAARALFSQLETSDLTIEEMMFAWDKAVSDCSNKTMMMTGLIIKIDKLTGELKAVNASHELPYIFKKTENGIKSEPLFIPAGARLGELKTQKWESLSYQLNQNEKLFIYTDGITAIENSHHQTLSEKNIIKNIEKLCSTEKNAETLSLGIYNYLENFRKNTELPDDITLVVIDWKYNHTNKQPEAQAS